ncbi:MAG: nucleotide sugar dehydrogenase [Dehalococcoidales bacterium]|nr:nucleotide sugar dehydrogenase [Dehalococcoidales bacterium]
MDKQMFEYDVCIVGGAGHVGLPLGLIFASKDQKVILYDVNKQVMGIIGKGQMPFIEYGAEPILKQVINKTLFLSDDIQSISKARFVVVAIGTPVDEYLNPKLRALLDLFAKLHPYLNNRQTIVIRSTVYPRTCAQILQLLDKMGGGPWHIAYCPERIVQGYAVKELTTLPQLISGLSERALHDVTELFSVIAPMIIPVTIGEAELSKLFSNAWRYIQFAVANQFYMIAQDFSIDFNKVRQAMIEGYGRAAGLPTAGFAAGPCLLKDTMQLFAFNNNNFPLGQAAMNVNEGLPGFIVEHLRHKYDLSHAKIGIIGMVFKADIDDIRDSLSYKLGKILRFYGANVLYSDEFVHDPTFISKEELVASCDIVIVGVPHSAYKTLVIPSKVEVVDIWGFIGK